MASPKNVIIIGGGWAGLAAAVELSRRGIPVTVVEAAPQLGGRARGLAWNSRYIDNGQHLFLGAYHDLLRIIKILGIPESQLFLRLPLALHMRSLKGDDFCLKTKAWLAPFHLLWGLLSAQGLSLLEKIKVVNAISRMASQEISAANDITVAELLAQYHQTPALIECLWEPLCLATLNTPLQSASAQLFVKVIKDTLLSGKKMADLLIARKSLAAILPQPAHDFVLNHGGTVLLGVRVSAVQVEQNRVTGIECQNRFINADYVIMATSARECLRLLKPISSLNAMTQKLAQLNHEPIATVYLQYPPQVTLPQPLMGITQGTSQWIFDRGITGYPGLMAVVISSSGPHQLWDKTTLAQQVSQELALLFPAWPAPLESLVIREKRATFAAVAKVNLIRPACATPVRGLWMAGDYTHLPYPATLEGAVRSGMECAAGINASPFEIY